MRVGVYTFRIEDRPTGLARYAIELTRALRDLNRGVEIVLLNPHSSSTLSWYSEFPTYPLDQGKGLNKWMQLAAAPPAINKAARALNLDIVHAPGNVAPFIAKSGRVGHVATVHDLAPLTLPDEHRLMARLAYAAAIPTLRWTADAVLTVSETSSRELISRGHLPTNQVFVTPNGVHAPSDVELRNWRTQGIPEAGMPSGCPFLLFVGDVRPRKNLSRLIAAFADLSHSHPDLRLIVAGQEMHRVAEAFELAGSLQNRIIRLGYVSDDLLHRLYASALAIAMPSLAEGFGLPALEAMAHGAPILISDLPVLTEMVGDASVVVDPTSVDSICAGMRRILDRPADVARMKETARARALLYTWKRTAEDTLKVYEGVLRSR